VTDTECVEFLQDCLPRLGLRWAGFRKVRGQVCKRIRRRLKDLDLGELDAYRGYLAEHADEWRRLDGFCRITISRFNRDRGVFEALASGPLPVFAGRAAAERRPLAAWSAGCASGEEAYTLKLMWDFDLGARFPGTAIDILATDCDAVLLRRAREACYPGGSLRELPTRWRAAAFERRNGAYCLCADFRSGIAFRKQDLRTRMPGGSFDLILCRNLAFTYFAPPLQERVLHRLLRRLRSGGALVIGGHETLPGKAARLGLSEQSRAIWINE